MPELNEIFDNVMALPLHERAYLAEMLLKSVHGRKTDAWTDIVKQLAGAWADFPDISRLREGMGEDIPRESF